jgi:hypothetical protein
VVGGIHKFAHGKYRENSTVVVYRGTCLLAFYTLQVEEKSRAHFPL